ncbi:capsular polysaccharide export protein [Sinorhizobium terangae]|nr:glycosyltransferase [Sinorhizobium terangae]MBB4184218.1 capsular polysaccharide export protein [Sinorhizobium terangae]
MADENKIAYEKFDDFLTLRRIEVQSDTDFDIREKILSGRRDVWNIGYVSGNLKNAYAANLSLLFPSLIPVDQGDFGAGEKYMILGTVYRDEKKSHKGAVRALREYRQGQELFLFEQGFLASTHSWSEAFRQKDPRFGCLGYVYDDIAHYFMADYPNRLIHRLNSKREITDAERLRAGQLIKRIVEKKISKYNSQPLIAPAMNPGYARRVLVCDQAFADASTVYGKIDEKGFEAMLVAALRENPDAEIIVKTHPDTYWEKGQRLGYYNHLKDNGRVRILREPVNPYSLFEHVDKVYVGTSQLGLEALFAGKKVVCFGAPFYSGWGLTDDRQTVPHRHRNRSLEEIFHYFYIWYTIYHVPGAPSPSEIEDVLDYIEKNRPVALPPTVDEITNRPKVSVILPVYGVENYIEESLSSLQRQTLRNIEIIPINDCSPDGCQQIIDRLAAEDPRIKPVVLKENIGQGFARNEGLKAARGDYILFLDPDDFMASSDHLERAVTCAEADRADMVRGRKLNERVEDEKGNFVKNQPDGSEVFFDEPFHAVTLAEEPRILHSRHFCNWLYRRDFLEENNIRFLTTQWEERPFVLKALLRAKRISGIDSEAFVYRIRTDSTARREKTVEDCWNQLSNFGQVVDLLTEAGACSTQSPLFFSARFQVTQFFHYLMFGFAFKTVRESGRAGQAAFLEQLREILRKSGLTAGDLSFEPIQLSRRHVVARAYELLFEAVRSGRHALLSDVIDLKPINQTALFEELLTPPLDDAHGAYLDALSFYARNERVKAAKAGSFRGKRPQVIVHIGSSKTGSTYLQHFMENNRPGLLRMGVWFPEVGLFWQQDRPHKQAGHAPFTKAAVTKDRSLKDYIEAGLKLSGGKIHTVILSSEAYFLNTNNSLKIVDYFAEYPVKMIGYFRRQDDWANSQYCEFVGGGAVGKVDKPIDEWLALPITQERLCYRTTIDQWAEKVGKENVIVRPYEKEQFVNGDLIDDFFDSIGMSACTALPRPAQASRNDFPLDARHLRIMLLFNNLPFRSTRNYLQFVEAVTVKLAQKYPKPARPNMLTNEQRRTLLSDQAENNAYIARTYLGREDGRLFSDLTVNQAAQQHVADIPAEDFELFMESYRSQSGIDEMMLSGSGASAKSKNGRQLNGQSGQPRKSNPPQNLTSFQRLLMPAFRIVVRHYSSEIQVTKFNADPIAFFANRKSKAYRKFGQLVYTQKASLPETAHKP